MQSFKDLLSEEKAFIFVADNDDNIVGYLLGFIHTTFFANGDAAWLEEIMVDEKFRRKGICIIFQKAIIACRLFFIFV